MPKNTYFYHLTYKATKPNSRVLRLHLHIPPETLVQFGSSTKRMQLEKHELIPRNALETLFTYLSCSYMEASMKNEGQTKWIHLYVAYIHTRVRCEQECRRPLRHNFRHVQSSLLRAPIVVQYLILIIS